MNCNHEKKKKKLLVGKRSSSDFVFARVVLIKMNGCAAANEMCISPGGSWPVALLSDLPESQFLFAQCSNHMQLKHQAIGRCYSVERSLFVDFMSLKSN